MKIYPCTLLLSLVCMQSTLCIADPVAALSEQTKTALNKQLQDSAKVAATIPVSSAPATPPLPQNLSNYRNGQNLTGEAADNLNNQHAYQDQIRLYLKNQKKKNVTN